MKFATTSLNNFNRLNILNMLDEGLTELILPKVKLAKIRLVKATFGRIR
jgi:hypothetical protein